MATNKLSLPVIDLATIVVEEQNETQSLKPEMQKIEDQRKSTLTSPRANMTLRVIRRAPRFVATIIKQRSKSDTGPHSLTHTTTFKCNYHCKEICDSPLVHQAMQKKPNGHDLSTDEICNIYRQLPAMDYVRFTGGEPTLRQDFIELSHLAEEHLQPIVIHMTTNASLPERVVQFAVERPRHVPLDLMISIDGVAEKHCASRHHHRAFDRCMETVKELSPRQRELKLNIRINQTIADSEGIEHYRKLHDLLKEFKVRHQIVMAYNASATYAVERDKSYAPTREELFTPVGEFQKDELDRFFRDVRADAKAELSGPERWIQQYYLDGIRARMIKNEPSPNPPCVALSSHLRIFPNGDIPTCQFNSHIVGNLRLQSFQEVWRSTERRSQYEWVKRCAGCWAGCEVQPSAAYTGDLLLHQLRPRA
jgi:Fe-coproporphyrin III synthase